MKEKKWIDRPLLPPRVRDWKKGTPQVGVFLRTELGSTVQCVKDRATEDDVILVTALLNQKLPPSILEDLRTWHKGFKASPR